MLFSTWWILNLESSDLRFDDPPRTQVWYRIYLYFYEITLEINRNFCHQYSSRSKMKLSHYCRLQLRSKWYSGYDEKLWITTAQKFASAQHRPNFSLQSNVSPTYTLTRGPYVDLNSVSQMLPVATWKCVGISWTLSKCSSYCLKKPIKKMCSLKVRKWSL